MRKQAAPRRKLRKSPPAMAAYFVAKEVELQERIAVDAFRADWGDTKHYNVLIDCHFMLKAAARRINHEEALQMCAFADIALAAIRERWERTKKIGATGEEFAALRALVDYSQDWWKLRSGALFADAHKDLEELREWQLKEASNATVL